MISRIIIFCSSSSWFIIWIMIEINLITFIPIILNKGLNTEIEARVKYFLIQTIRSILILLLFINNYVNSRIRHYFYLPQIFIFIILLKLGAAPCHLWYPPIIGALSWMNCFFLSTTQKLIPTIIFIIYIKNNRIQIVCLLVALNRLVGGWGGLNQSQIRPLLAYSSINHLSWLISSTIFSITMPIVYFLIYRVINSTIFYRFWLTKKKKIFNFDHLKDQLLNPLIPLSLLSLAGIPPLLGFFPKWLILSNILPLSPLIAIFLILGSLISLYYYMIITITTITSSIKLLTTKKSYFRIFATITILLGPTLLLIYAMTLLH